MFVWVYFPVQFDALAQQSLDFGGIGLGIFPANAFAGDFAGHLEQHPDSKADYFGRSDASTCSNRFGVEVSMELGSSKLHLPLVLAAINENGIVSFIHCDHVVSGGDDFPKPSLLCGQ